MDQDGPKIADAARRRPHGGPGSEKVEINDKQNDCKRINQQRKIIILFKCFRVETEVERYAGKVDTVDAVHDVPKTRVRIHQDP